MRSMFRSVLVALVPVFLMIGAGTAMAETPTYLCVPETAGQTVTSGGSEGKCEAKNTKVELPPTAELATLQSILPHIKYEAEGIDKKPTIQFSAVNVQVINGQGKTKTVNGVGNLVIGYDELAGTQTGSHNLILGEELSYTSYGGIDAGYSATLTGPFSAVLGEGTASGEESSVVGGAGNLASGQGASVSGGFHNTASGHYASISGGAWNLASGEGGFSSISGGYENTASGTIASVGGGFKNTASGHYASIFGGKELKAEKEYEALP
jgi:hypothetical protein